MEIELKELLRPFSPTFPTDDIHIRRGEKILNPLFWAGAAGTVVLVPLYIAFFTGAAKSFGTTLSDLLLAVPIAMLWTGFSFIVCLFNHHQWKNEIFEYKEKELARINAEIRAEMGAEAFCPPDDWTPEPWDTGDEENKLKMCAEARYLEDKTVRIDDQTYDLLKRLIGNGKKTGRQLRYMYDNTPELCGKMKLEDFYRAVKAYFPYSCKTIHSSKALKQEHNF